MLRPVPMWPILIYADAPADAPADYEVGFAGLTPLTRISRVPAEATAAAVLRLSAQCWMADGVVAAADAQPLYVRDKVAQTTAERELLKAARAAATQGVQP